MPTTPNGDVSTNPTVNGATCHYPTLLMPQGDNTQDYTYTVHYSFLCPEICTKDTSGNIIRDISDASSITNSEPAVNKSYKYNTTCTNTYTKVKDDNVLLYAIDSHHPSKFCLNGWAHN
jgi:hypothetical protein